MANEIYYPLLNPIRTVRQGSPQFINFDNDWFKNQVPFWQQPQFYAQKWLVGSTVTIQFFSNFSPVQFNIYRCTGELINTITPVLIDTGAFNIGYQYYQATFVVPDIDDIWYMQMQTGFEDTTDYRISEPQQTLQSNRGLFEIVYWNSYNDQDIYFAGGVRFTKYIEGYMGELSPKSNRTVWEDQTANLKSVKGIPYREFKVFFGGTYNAGEYVSLGIPQYEGDFLNRVFNTDKVFLNNVQYTQSEGAEWDKVSTDLTSLWSFSTDIRPTRNQFSDISGNNNAPSEAFFVTYNIKTDLFGTFNGPASNNTIQITEAHAD